MVLQEVGFDVVSILPMGFLAAVIVIGALVAVTLLVVVISKISRRV